MTVDLLIVGGGINGCAIAREAALNGLSVLLVERDDLASHTSSASTKLIHGGLRYLEYYDFGLVAEALRERERLLKAAPHLIQPLTFVLPHEHALRPWWMVRLGLALYDRIGGRISLPHSRSLSARDIAYTAPLKGGAKGFVYSDAFVDDSRLTLANAIDAAEAGAEIATRTELLTARREGSLWHAMLSDGREVAARLLVNAAGPWVHLLLDRLGVDAKSDVRLVKGSHIVVPRLYEGNHAYILQQPDRRIVFALPWQGETAVGTTDIPVVRPEDAVIRDDEVDYLCDAINRHFVAQIGPGDVTSAWSGIRPLYDDGAKDARAVTRDYVLELDNDGAPLLSVFGGKITTARHLAEDALKRIAPHFDFEPAPVTRSRPFPGGATGRIDGYIADTQERWPFLGKARATRMVRAYGTRIEKMLAGIHAETEMGRAFGAGFTEIEARWMRAHEWARTSQDALEQRSKLGLHMTADERAAFATWWDAQSE